MANVNPNILLAARGIPTRSPMQSMAQMLQLQSAIQGQQMNAMQMRAAEAAMAEQSRARDAAAVQQARQQSFWSQFDGKLTPRTVAVARFAGIDLDDLKKAVESRNWGRDKVSMTDTGGQLLPMNEYGDTVGAPVPKTATPGERMTASRAREQFEADQAYREQQIALQRSGQSLTRRGQDLADARGQEQLRIQRDAIGSGKAPAGYRIGRDGLSLEFIPGGPADPTTKPLTETQAKANLFSNRALAADKILAEVEPSISGVERYAMGVKQGAEGVPLIGGVLAGVGNVLATEDMQRYEQAQRDFINAVLRQESGAVIADTEFDNARKQYFPQPGDTPAVMRQKAENRRMAIQGIAEAAGAQGPEVPALPPPQQPSQRAAGQITQPMQMDDMPDPSTVPPGSVITDNVTGQSFRATPGGWEPL